MLADLGRDASALVGGSRGHSADALTLGFELAAAHYRPLHVVHALGGQSLFPCPDLIGHETLSRSRDAAGRYLDECLSGYDEKFPDVQVHRQVVQETPTQALVAASRTASAVIVGRGRRPVHSQVLGSVSRGVVERAHSTVVVVGGAGR